MNKNTNIQHYTFGHDLAGQAVTTRYFAKGKMSSNQAIAQIREHLKNYGEVSKQSFNPSCDI